MKAIQIEQFGGPDVLKLVELPEPALRPGDILIRQHAIAVNPVDTYVRQGKYGPRPMPYVLGLAGAGEVIAMGDQADGFREGDRVYFFNPEAGAYAEVVRCPASRVYALPCKVSQEEGACVGVAGATAWRALFGRGEAHAGQTVLVHGATGGVGTAAVQLAHAAGLKVVGTGGSEAGRAMLQKLGASLVLDHHAADYLEEARTFTAGRGVDLVLEMLADVNLDRDLAILAPQGKVIIIGSRGRVEIDPRQTMGKDSDIRGMALFNTSEAELRQIHYGLYSAMQHGTYRPLVAQTFGLEDVARAHEAVLASHSPGGIILRL